MRLFKTDVLHKFIVTILSIEVNLANFFLSKWPKSGSFFLIKLSVMQRELFLITVICSIIIFPFTVFSEPISEEILNFKIKGNDQSKEDPNEQGDSSRVDTKNLKPFDYLMIEKQGLSDSQNNSGLIGLSFQ